ncbi:uncharacterized protein LOC110735220 [Chenopodium quinoa]|uniref:uncharacterized protein LOC110735220 n=1 Tax=Chenopodium quinoa TaxID=63459 RepID=UPI000B7938C8|nr:uncharacterized protein LOC110735220 [Chenopodium quinoa]
MEFFKKAKVVRLRSQHNKYLTASEDEEAVKQTRSGSSKNARWTVEPIEGKPNVIRLKNCNSWKYLTASEEPFLLGWTGKRVLQSSPRLRLDSTVEWEPIKEGSVVKLRTRNGNFLRGNGGVPPWNNSVTHDVPSRSATQDWIFWTVDVVEVDYKSMDEVDYKSMDEVEDKKGVVEDLVGCNVEDHGSLSRNSSYASTIIMEEVANDFHEVGSPVASSTPKSARSVRSNSEVSATPSPRASPTASDTHTPTRVSPHVQNIRDESKHSGSFNKLKSMLDGLQDLLDGTEEEEEDDTKVDADSETSVEYASNHHPHQLEVKMAKQTLKELNNMDFETVLSSGRDKKMDKSISILIADAKVSYRDQTILKDLTNLRNKLKSMRNDRELACQELNEYTTFCTRRLEVKAELKKDAAKAHELETIEDGFSKMLATARAKRDNILKQLEEVDSRIKAAEKTQADNAVDIEELISRIGENSQSLREMEKNEKSWQAKKVEAENKLESVEEEWKKMKSLLQDV